MTREEAIKILHPISDEYCQMANIRMTQAEDDICEALDMSIKALSAEPCEDAVSRQAAIEALARMMPRSYTPDGSHPADEEIFQAQEVFADCIEALEILPSAQPATSCSEIPNSSTDCISRQAVVKFFNDWISCLDENCHHQSVADMTIIKNDFKNLPSVQPEIIRCKDCKHFEYDHPYIIQGIPVLGHEVCNAWGDGCKTDENGYCFMAERRTDERFDRQTGGD